jgi:hypothetical protein
MNTGFKTLVRGGRLDVWEPKKDICGTKKVVIKHKKSTSHLFW